MDTTKLVAIVSIILAVSIASERLVEIIKGFIPVLDKENDNQMVESMRRACLHILAAIAGMLTAWLARDYLPTEVAKPADSWAIVGLGLLASGGSSFWNSILTYFLMVKNIKELEVIRQRSKGPCG